MLIQPKFYLLDTNQLNNWISDFISTDKDRKLRAKKFLKRLENFEFAPVITFEHIQEIVAHADINLVHQRLRILQALPFRITILNRDHALFGPCFEVIYYEIDELVSTDGGVLSIENIRSRIIGTNFDVSLLIEDEIFFRIFRRNALNAAKQLEFTTAIMRMPQLFPGNQTLEQFLSPGFRSDADRIAKIHQIGRIATATASKLGDKRIERPESVGLAFTSELLSASANKPKDATLQSFSEHMQQLAGIPSWALEPSTKMREFSRLVHIGSMSKFYSEYSGFPQEVIFRLIFDKKLPSYEISNSIQTQIDASQRSKRSIVIDTQFACLSPYFDRVYLDKHVHDKVLRSKNSNAMYSSLMNVERACSYFDI